MSVPRCSACGAELLPEANFCRQCGRTVTSGSAVNSSEEPTLTLNERVGNITTQRLDPRPTSPDPGSIGNPTRNSVATGMRANTLPPRRGLPAASIVGGIVLVVILGIVSSVAIVRMRSHSRTTDNATLIYPGAQTVVDMTSDEGRAIQLQTGDSLDRVLAWYEGILKPTKTMRLTSTSFVLRNQNVTATIATEDNKTNILIKQSLTP
ncbi:MAG: zinc ribbon domain-containing protein [Pyrinomonadaceae bacterium]|nr:zinc ribbon domain-containing protein [Pyrinomonadaceae bacterium]